MIIIHLGPCFILVMLFWMSQECIFPYKCGFKLWFPESETQKSPSALREVYRNPTSWTNSSHGANWARNPYILCPALDLTSGPHNNFACTLHFVPQFSLCFDFWQSTGTTLGDLPTKHRPPIPIGLPLGGKGTPAQLGKLLNPPVRLSRANEMPEHRMKQPRTK